MDSRVLLSIIFPSSLENYFFFVVRYKKKAFLIIELFLSKLSNFQDNYIAWPFLYPQTIASFFFFFSFLINLSLKCMCIHPQRVMGKNSASCSTYGIYENTSYFLSQSLKWIHITMYYTSIYSNINK